MKKIFSLVVVLGILFPVLSFASTDLTCSANPSSVSVGDDVVWVSTFDNSSTTVDYQFYWSQTVGNDSVTGDTSSFTAKFSTPGTKTLSLDVFGSDNSTRNATCNVIVNATTTPEVPATPRRTSGGGRVATGQVAGVSTTTEPVGQVLGESTFVFNTDLGYGMSNDDVMELQKRLTEEGVYTGPITGYFGDLTLAAVKLYQAKHNIIQTGFVGILTRTALNNADNTSLVAFVKMLIEIGAIYGDKATFLRTVLGF